MTLKEFDMIRPFLKDDANIEIEIKKIYDANKSITAKSKAKLKREYWGSHDGSYNMFCSNCGWRSTDIHPGDTEPTKCPVCDN